MAKKRHHYIPQFYLKGFVDPQNEPYIWVYDKDNGRIIKSSAKDIAVEKHYFSFIDKLGRRDSETLENFLEKTETEAAPVINKLLKEESLNEEEQVSFAFFVALMMMRTPNYRKNTETLMTETIKKISMIMASHKEGFESEMKNFERDTGEKIESVEELRKFMQAGEYDIKVNPNVTLAMSMSHIEPIAEVFYKMRWRFLKATDDYKFLSGDNPLFYFDPTHNPNSFYGVGLANKNIEVTLPLSIDIMAFGTWKSGGSGYVQLKNNTIKQVNRRTGSSTLKFVFASKKSEKIKKFVMKYKGSAPVIIVD